MKKLLVGALAFGSMTALAGPITKFNCSPTLDYKPCLKSNEVMIQGFHKGYCESRARYTSKTLAAVGIAVEDQTSCFRIDPKINDLVFGNDQWASSFKINQNVQTIEVITDKEHWIKGATCEEVQHQLVSRLHREEALVLQVTPCMGAGTEDFFVRYLPNKGTSKTTKITNQLETELLALAYLSRGKISEVRKLVDSGLDVNLVGDFGETLWKGYLKHSATNDDFRHLVAKGFNIKNPAVLTDTIVKGNHEIIETLLSKGAPVNIGCSYIPFAMGRKNSIQIMETLIAYGEKTSSLDCYGQGQTPPFHAVTSDELKFLLEHGGNVNKIDPSGNTLIHKAAWACDVEKVKILLQYKAVLTNTDDYGWTPLHHALVQKNPKCDEVTRMLATADTDLNGKHGFMTNPLTDVAGKGNYQKTKILLEAGADPNFLNNNILGTTPLLEAINSGSLPVIKVLLEYGANKTQSYTYEGYYQTRPSGKPLKGHMYPSPYQKAKGKGLSEDILNLLRLPNCEFLVESDLNDKMTEYISTNLIDQITEKGYVTRASSKKENDFGYIFNFKEISSGKNQKSDITLSVVDRVNHQSWEFDLDSRKEVSLGWKSDLKEVINSLPSCQYEGSEVGPM